MGVVILHELVLCDKYPIQNCNLSTLLLRMWRQKRDYASLCTQFPTLSAFLSNPNVNPLLELHPFDRDQSGTIQGVPPSASSPYALLSPLLCISNEGFHT